jgi:actin-related protein 2
VNPLSSAKDREKLIEMMLEKYEFHAVNVSNQAMLTLYGQGLSTGVVVDIGEGVTHVVPVLDGIIPQHLVRHLNVAGRHITSYLMELLMRRAYAFDPIADSETVRQIKEKACYVADDINQERALTQETTCLISYLMVGRSRSRERDLRPQRCSSTRV